MATPFERLREFNPGKKGGRLFFCDGEGTQVQRAFREGKVTGSLDRWFCTIAKAAVSPESAACYLADSGHWLPQEFGRSRARVRAHLLAVAGPVQAARSGQPWALPAGLQERDFLASWGVGAPLAVLEALTVPISFYLPAQRRGQVLSLCVELVGGTQPSGEPPGHFPCSSITFAPVDDGWLSAFDTALAHARQLVASAAKKPPDCIGSGLALRWRFELKAYWNEVWSGDLEALSRVSFEGGSASAAFGLAAARLLARHAGFIPGRTMQDPADNLSLCEWRALPLEGILVTAEAGAHALHRVGGLELSEGGLPPKLAPLEAFRKRQRLLAVGVASGDAHDVGDILHDVPLVRAGTLGGLARALFAAISQQCFGEASPLPRDRAEKAANAHDAVLGDIGRRIQAASYGQGSCTVIEAGRAFGREGLGLRWAFDSMSLGESRFPRLAGWAFGHGGLRALDHSLRLNLAIPLGPQHTAGGIAATLREASAWSLAHRQPVLLFIDSGDGAAAGALQALPSPMPAGVHLWIAAPPGRFDAAKAGWDVFEADGSGGTDDAETLGLFRLAEMPPGWPAPGRVLAAALDGPAGARFEFAAPEYRVIPFERPWLNDLEAFRDEVGTLDPAIPCVIAGWPGGENTRKLDAWLEQAALAQGAAVLQLCRPPLPVRAPAQTLAHLCDLRGRPQLVELSTLPGLDRGPYVLLVETRAPDAVLLALVGAESRLPPGAARRWWLTFDGVEQCPEDLVGDSVPTPDARWLRRGFAREGLIGCFMREPGGTGALIAQLATRHSTAAIVVTSPCVKWLDRVAAGLSQAGRPAWRAQSGGMPWPPAQEPELAHPDFAALARAPEAFVDAMADDALARGLVPGDDAGAECAVLFAAAWLRAGRADRTLLDALRGMAAARADAAAVLDCIATGTGALDRTAQAVRLAARCGAPGRRAIDRLLRGCIPRPHDGVFWTAVWTAGPDALPLAAVKAHPTWRAVLGLKTDVAPPTRDLLDAARTGFPPPLGDF